MNEETCDLPKPTAPVALSDHMWVGPTPKPGMLHQLSDRGFRSIINNQPDTEDGLLISSREVAAEAEAIGLSYLHIPIEGRNPLEKDVRSFSEALAKMPGPIFAYCRTGGRSASLWAMASVQQNDTETLIAKCRQIGFDISGLRAKMDMRREMIAAGELDD